METILGFYHQVFPHTHFADWFYALCGLLLHAAIKIRHLKFGEFQPKRFFGEFLPVWFFCVISIVVLLGILPIVWKSYNLLDAALIGYASSSIIKQLLKNRRFGNLNVLK